MRESGCDDFSLIRNFRNFDEVDVAIDVFADYFSTSVTSNRHQYCSFKAEAQLSSDIRDTVTVKVTLLVRYVSRLFLENDWLLHLFHLLLKTLEG